MQNNIPGRSEVPPDLNMPYPHLPTHLPTPYDLQNDYVNIFAPLEGYMGLYGDFQSFSKFLLDRRNDNRPFRLLKYSEYLMKTAHYSITERNGIPDKSMKDRMQEFDGVIDSANMILDSLPLNIEGYWQLFAIISVLNKFARH